MIDSPEKKGTPSRKRSNDDLRKSDASRAVTAVTAADPADLKKLISEIDTLKKTISEVTAQKESLERVCYCPLLSLFLCFYQLQLL